MAHVRSQIRDAVVTALTGLQTATEVFPSRAIPVPESRLPCLLVYMTEESSAIDSMRSGSGGRGLYRTVAIRVEGICQSTEALDQTADDIAAEVEAALAADIHLGGLTRDLQLTTTQIGFRDEGGQPVAGVRMIFAAEYRTRESAPQVSI